VDYTSRMFVFNDESNLGKTVTMLALMLGTGPVIPVDDPLLLQPTLIKTRASLVIVDPLQLKGKNDWRDWPRRLYPTSKVYTILNRTGWSRLSRHIIQAADLLVMSHDTYRDLYRAGTEYATPETTSIVDYQWQRVVLDDAPIDVLTYMHRIQAWAHFHVRSYPGQAIRDPLTLRIRPQSAAPLWYWRPESTSLLYYYLLPQLTWRRTVRTVSNELVRPMSMVTRTPIHLSDPEMYIRYNVRDYVIPAKYTYTMGNPRVFPASEDAEPVSLTACLKWTLRHRKSQKFDTMRLEDFTMPMGDMVLHYGSLVTALLLLLREHWQLRPTKCVLIGCDNGVGVAAVSQFLKKQHIPVRTVSTTVNLRYTEAEYAAIKALGRTRTMAIVADIACMKVAWRRFKHIRHVMILTGEHHGVHWDRHFVSNMAQPVSVNSPVPTVTATMIYPADSPTEAVDATVLPYRDMGIHWIDF